MSKPNSLGEFFQLVYDLTSPSAQWEAGLAKTMAPDLDQGRGLFLATACMKHGRLEIERFQRFFGATVDFEHASRLILQEHGPQVQGLAEGPSEAALLSEFLPLETIAPQLKQLGLEPTDTLSVFVRDSLGAAMMFGAPLHPQQAPDLRACAKLGSMARHAGAAFRLRRVLDSDLNDATESIFDTDGRPLHAVGLAKEQPLQTLLREKVRKREAALSTAAEAAGDNVDDLIAGRWSLVDRFESDGRRYIVAYRNPAGMIDPRRLSPREAEILRVAATGMGDEELSKQLGVSKTTVTSHLHRVIHKLGLRGRAEVPAFYRDISGDAQLLHEGDDFYVLARGSDFEVPGELTESEAEVARLTHLGLSNTAIALQRGVKTRTVSNQLHSIFQKLGIRSRVELASRIENG